jgi:hypothetical protein
MIESRVSFAMLLVVLRSCLNRATHSRRPVSFTPPQFGS